jgi:hypothetical protein
MVEVTADSNVRAVFRSLRNIRPFGRLNEVEQYFGTTFRVAGGLPLRIALAATQDPIRASNLDLFDFAPAASIISVVHNLGPEESPPIREALSDVIPNFECFRWNISCERQLQSSIERVHRAALVPVLTLQLSSDAEVGWIDPFEGLEDVSLNHFRAFLQYPLDHALTDEQRVSVLLIGIRYLQALALARLPLWEYQPGSEIIPMLLRVLDDREINESVIKVGAKVSVYNALNSLMSSVNNLEELEGLDSRLIQKFSLSSFPGFYPNIKQSINQSRFLANGSAASIWPSHIWSWRFGAANPLCEDEFMNLNIEKCVAEFEEMCELRSKEERQYGFQMTRLDTSQKILAASPNFLLSFGKTDLPEYECELWNFDKEDQFVFLTIWMPEPVLQGIVDSEISILAYVSSPEPSILSLPYAVASEFFYFGGARCRKVSIRLNFASFWQAESLKSPIQKAYRVRVGLIVESEK